MKYLLGLIVLILNLNIYSQKNKPNSIPKKYLTKKYAGKYGYGKSAESGAIGVVTIYPESDSTVLFYFEANIGPPSYNMGSMYERVKIVKDTGLFQGKVYTDTIGCKFTFKFSKNKLKIIASSEFDYCGFGNRVSTYGDYTQSSNKIPESFTNLEGTEIFFSKMRPEDYNKN